MSVLITGGCGFIGSNFINYYFPTMQFKKLVNLDVMYYSADIKNITDIIRADSRYVFIKGNINDKELTCWILKEYNITHVIHFAAQSHVQTSFENSLQFTQDNVMGTHNLLESCRLYGNIKKFIHVSTDEVYGESMSSKKTEHSILRPTNPYAATKAGAELIAQSYWHSYKFPVIITRGSNVYGPNQYPEKIIPFFIKQLNEGHKVPIQGNGAAIRGFLHSYDVAIAFGLILDKGVLGEIYNIGCDENMEYSVMDIAKILIKLIKHTDNYNEFITYTQDRPFNDQRYYISNTKLKDLGWNITVDLMTGLKALITYMKVLVYGGHGWIGGQFTDILMKNNVMFVCGKARVDNEDDVLLEIIRERPTHIISFIGRTHGEGYTTIDYLEQKGKLNENIRDNLYSPIILADICREKGIHYTYLGTGCIFTYDDVDNEAGFNEKDKPNFFGSSYSIVKGYTDRLMHRYPVLNLRIRMPIVGYVNPFNFITKITTYKRICSMPNSMTVLPELLPLVLDMMNKKIIGTINLTNPGVISHNEILEMYKDIVDTTFTWSNFTIEEQNKILASERSNNLLDTTKLSQMYPNVKPIGEAIKICLLAYKYNPLIL